VSEEESAITYNHERQEYLVVWQAAEIWGRRVEIDGLAGAMGVDPLWIRATADNETAPAAAGSESNDRFLVTWT
jgi:hypothetical protein